MDKSKIDLYLTTNAKFFEAQDLPRIREKLEGMSDDDFMIVQSTELKDPTTMLLLSLFLGSFGVDRFMVGDTGLGIGKLLTGGGCGIWTIIDWFMIMGRTKKINFDKINMIG